MADIIQTSQVLPAQGFAGAIPKQRFYVVSDTQVFAATSPMLPYTMDAAGKPATIQMNPTDIAVRRK